MATTDTGTINLDMLNRFADMLTSDTARAEMRNYLIGQLAGVVEPDAWATAARQAAAMAGLDESEGRRILATFEERAQR